MAALGRFIARGREKALPFFKLIDRVKVPDLLMRR
jgi:hypothetical protein